ncbi:MAG: tRNA lysidine(34) synthetase TilS [Bacteroidetes bacterium]|nr:tRNA lysidine(34) synthetase TilS [Bacteroidota bacterium]
MNEAFLSFLTQKKLCTPHHHILVAVSGGQDSMALLHLFVRAGFRVSVAHVNFQLRGKESDQDQEFVKNFCRAARIPFYSKKFQTEKYAVKKSLSIQMAARALRYGWFHELMLRHRFDRLATAHHLNDSIETVLINITRGTGLEGLDGIAAKNKNIIRPLLFATREQIHSYVKENKIRWREDASNNTDDYVRNYLRHQVIPKLKKINPSLEDSVADMLEKTAAGNELAEAGLLQWREKFETIQGDQIFFLKKGFSGFHNPCGLLWLLVKKYGFHFDQCRQAIRSLDKQSGKKFLSDNYVLGIDRKSLILSPQKKEEPAVTITKNKTQVTWGVRQLKISTPKKIKISTDRYTALLDSAKLTFPIIWRAWKKGDFFYPLGMDKRKKVSDFLIDRKISISEKKNVTVIESAGEIAWLVGYRISDRFKITDRTQALTKLEFKTTALKSGQVD